MTHGKTGYYGGSEETSFKGKKKFSRERIREKHRKIEEGGGPE
jgi:hypothetical protein